MMPTDDPSLTAFLDLDAPGEPAFVFDGTAISRAELSGARMLIMQSSFRSTDFAADPERDRKSRRARACAGGSGRQRTVSVRMAFSALRSVRQALPACAGPAREYRRAAAALYHLQGMIRKDVQRLSSEKEVMPNQRAKAR
jgi:hypothetical protein